MSHQTGIKANDELKKFLAKCRDGKVRVVKISIENEQLQLSDHKPVKGNWEKDFDNSITPLVEENQPCYILYRLDSKNSSGYEWLFISWCPDTSPVRQKMLYASTKLTLKQEFGSSQVKEELHATILSDVTLIGYQKYKRAAVEPVPLTLREEELQELRKSEVRTEISVDSKQQSLTGVAFPMTQDSRQAILDMAKGSYDYLQFKIDVEEEIIHLVTAENLSISKLPSRVPEDRARYHLYKFKHNYEGDCVENVVFIYSMPGYNCSIKERVLYSSCTHSLTARISELGVEISKKIEVESGAELTEEFLHDELHPKKTLHRPKFAKPKGPPNRGPKRVTKSQNTDN